MKPKLAIFTLCRDRLDYTKICLPRLWETNADMPEHLIIDNGSEDDTWRWIAESKRDLPFVKGIRNDKNEGIAPATMQAVRWFLAGKEEPDVLIKFDNDCFVHSLEILDTIATVYEKLNETGFSKLILSPRVTGINRQPNRQGGLTVGSWKIGFTGIVGGLFQCVPFSFYKSFQFPPNMSPAYGQDDLLCDTWRLAGGRNGYLEDLLIEHYETTDGQARRYPEYHARKVRENPMR